RDAGADLVIVTAHAGSYCSEFDDPRDLSSCDLAGEIMRVALDLPGGLVDQIIAGHRHEGIAHEVNGIAITSSYSNTRAFGRVDYVFDRASRRLTRRRIFEPQPICGFVDTTNGGCLPGSSATADDRASYSDRQVVPNADVAAIAAEATARSDELKSEKLGVTLAEPITRAGRSDSAIGHLFTEIVLAGTGVDAVVHNVVGGIRADLPAGELVYGDVYEMYPFDNIVVPLDLSGAQLRELLGREATKTRARAGISGIRVFVRCEAGALDVSMERRDGTAIDDDDVLTVMTTDFLATGGDDVLTPVIPDGGFEIDNAKPLVREVIADWLRNRGGSIDAETFSDAGNPKWNIDASVTPGCSL
ncbi:5'-nucleotidase C-terminal domain-containing protein, partial [bacterium]|nr:5'-nucleotidase C-terminal domain-containing protein [bacterium]